MLPQKIACFPQLPPSFPRASPVLPPRILRGQGGCFPQNSVLPPASPQLPLCFPLALGTSSLCKFLRKTRAKLLKVSFTNASAFLFGQHYQELRNLLRRKLKEAQEEDPEDRLAFVDPSYRGCLQMTSYFHRTWDGAILSRLPPYLFLLPLAPLSLLTLSPSYLLPFSTHLLPLAS